MTQQTPLIKVAPVRTEADMAGDPDAIAGLAMVRARVALCTPAERDAFWEAVRRCFGGTPEAAGT